MHIGPHTFQEFCHIAEQFHGCAAPGLLLGAYMVELAKKNLPQGTLFEAVVESGKCLPDAVQLLSLCSIGNSRLKVHDLGKFAVSLFDKHTGEGVRVSLDPAKMAAWPEIYSWFLKKKPKQEQDSALLAAEIEAAGENICKLEHITIKPAFMGHGHMGAIACCPLCGEAYPEEDGPTCRGCQGQSPCQPAAKTDQPC